MATNPMKRRERNAFLIGFMIALAIMAVMVFIMFKLYQGQKDQLEALQAREVQVLVAAKTIESGKTLTEDDFTTATVITDMSSEDYYTDSYSLLGDPVVFVDENGNVEDNDDENAQFAVASRIEIPAGTIVTSKMFMKTDDVLTDDVRIQEYSSIVLPSQLKNGDFIDIRLSLPSGQDFIVLSKKEAIQTDEKTVWLKMDELDLLLLNSAMVDAWTIPGTKLYAIEYVDPGMQLASSISYQPSAEVAEEIVSNPNIVEEARKGLANDLAQTAGGRKMREYREYIDNALSEHIEERDSSVQAGQSEEITNIQTHRSEYVKALEGSGEIGNNDLPTSAE